MRLSSYTIEGELGAGGFGTVYRARDSDGRPVALKVARHRVRATRELVLQHNEIEALMRLDHPGLADLYEFGYVDDGQRMFIAMELIEGESLEQLATRRGRLDACEALDIASRIAQVVSYCHEHGVLHLDLSLNNIIIGGRDRRAVTVLDFGLSHTTATWAPAIPLGGTPNYMAPESFDGALPSQAIDQYALGVILYRLLAGALPFDGTTWAEIGHAKQHSQPIPLVARAPDVSEDLADIVHRMLAREPTRRFGSVAEVASELDQHYYAILAGTRPETSARFALTDDSVPFVGRARELSELSRAAADPSTTAIVVVGDSGIGKSRLCAAWFDRVGREGRFVAYGRCREARGVEPYFGLREALAQLVDHAVAVDYDTMGDVRSRLANEPAHMGLLATLVPELRNLVDDRNLAEPGVGFDGALQVATAVRMLLDAIGPHRLATLAIEDLHWADDGTLDVVAALAARGLPHGHTLVCTSRPTPLLDKLTGYRRVTIAALRDEDNRALLAALGRGLPAAALSRLQQLVPLLSTGNPLFNTNMMRHLSREGCFRRTAVGRPSLDEQRLTECAPPDSVLDVIDHAVARLDADTRAVLAVAALLGREFAIADLSALGLFSPRRVAAALIEAQRERLCTASRHRGQFVHETVRERIARAAIPFDRADVHARIARRLEARGAEIADLAHHLDRSGASLRAAAAFQQAGLRAARMQAVTAATRAFERGLELLMPLPRTAARDTLLAEIAFELVRAASPVLDTQRTLGLLDRIATLLDSAEHHAALDASYARIYYVRGDFAPARKHAARCLTGATHAAAPDRYQVAPLSILGRLQAISGKYVPAAIALERACSIASARNDVAELAHNAGVLGLCRANMGQYDRAHAHLDRGWELAQRIGDPVRMLASLTYYAGFADARFDYDEGVTYSTRALQFAEERGVTGLYRYLALLFAGCTQFRVGAMDRSIGLLTAAIEMAAVGGTAIGVGWAHGFLGDAELCRGRPEAARAHYRVALNLGNAGAGDELAAPLGFIGLAHYEALTGGSLQRVHALANECLRRLDAVGNRCTRIHALQHYADAVDLLGAQRDAALVRAQRELELARLGATDVTWHRPATMTQAHVAEPCAFALRTTTPLYAAPNTELE